jgi:hypothetical protein
MSRLTLCAVGLAVILHGPAWSQNSLPDPAATPGAINPDVTQDNIGDTICARGWTRMVRPPFEFTEAIKRRLVRESGYLDHRLSHYELDHLVPLELGGAPSDVRNLWIELRDAPNGWGADRKDEVEGSLKHLVCDGQLPLAEAQRQIAIDWITAYRRYVLEEAE